MSFPIIASKVLLPLSLLSPGVTGDAEFHQSPSGGIVWRLSEGTEQSSLSFDLDTLKIRPRDFDEIHLHFKPRGGEILWQPELTAYPVKGMRRHWYSKFPLQQNEWQTARFDLNLDDDGWWIGGKSDLEHRSLNIGLDKQWERVPGEANWREVEVDSIAFVRRVVGVDFDEMAARPIETKTETGWTYDLIVTNNDTQPHRAKLWLDTSRQKYFSADWKTKTVTLKPRERRIVPLQLSLPKTAAKELPPLYSEPVQAFIKLDEKDAVEFTPLRGYRPRYLWATLPPRQYKFPPIADSKKIVMQAEKVLLEDWGVPTYGPATHPQGYYNPATSKTPIPLSWFRHQDPQTGEIFTDDKYVLSYILTIHKDNFNRANLLADAFRASGDLRFASAARKVLLEYARQYPLMRPSAPDATSGRSRLGLNTLMSSYIFPQICDAYSKIKNSAALNESDREYIEDRFLKPEALAIYDHDIGYSNMQAEHYLAYMHAAFALEYWPLAGEAIYGDHGFYAMVEHAFSEDGISHEAGAYHRSTLAAMMNFAEFSDARGVNVMNSRFKRVFDGMVKNSPEGIPEDAALRNFYDFAYCVYRDPKYIPTLKAAKLWPPSYLSNVILKELATEESPNFSTDFVGTSGDPSATLVPRSAQDDDVGKTIGERLTESTVLPNVGYLWLREQSSRGFRALSINYISQWDRGEHDRLHFSLFDEEGRATSEIGRIIYSAPEAFTMENTFGHNTIVVDGKNQESQPSTLAMILNRPALPAALITEDPQSPLYPGIEFSRVVAILDGVFFVGDIYHGKGEHTYDWPFYAPWQPGDSDEIAVPRASLQLRELKSTFDEYPWVSKPRGARSDESISIDLRVAEAKNKNPRNLHLTFAPMKDALFVSALVPRGYRPLPGPMVFLRQEKRNAAQFGVAFDITAPDETYKKVRIENIIVTDTNGKSLDPSQAIAWQVQTTTGIFLILINRSGNKVKIGTMETTELLYVGRA